MGTGAGQQSHAGVSPSLSQPTVNDVKLYFATANGTGSASANLVLMRAIFNMGVPVSGKNILPSNIAGLPTWFSLRANKDGRIGRRLDHDIVIEMNPDSAEDDMQFVRPGAVLIIDEPLLKFVDRDNITVFPVPFAAITAAACPEAKSRRFVANMVYVGVVARLLHLDMAAVEAALRKQFDGKERAIDVNWKGILAGHAWADANLPDHAGYVIEPMDKTRDKILIDANTACAIGLLFGGVTVFPWYPITPSSSIAETLSELLDKYRRDPETGEATYAVVQAEDELAALGMAIGAGWAGARAATATSGPGMSLMAELAGLAYFAGIPCVIINVQRMGPSTGLPTRTSQGDILKAYTLSHGDTRHPLLIPSTIEECYEFSMQALDVAARLQTLVFVMTDLDLGMNVWMSDKFEPPKKPVDRGKILTSEQLDRIGEFARYRDLDGDGIGYRTLPGTLHPKGAYFTQGAGHDEQAKRSEKVRHWVDNLDRLSHKVDMSGRILPQPVIDEVEGATVALAGYGSSDASIEEAREILRDKHGIITSYMRLRALPPVPEVRAFCERHGVVYVVEQNQDAQMACALRMEFPGIKCHILGVLHYKGTAIDPQTIVDRLLKKLENKPQ